MEQQFTSILLEKAVSEFAKLPGIGRKTALRLVLHLLRCEDEEVKRFADAISTLKKEIKHCNVCHNISDTDICPICSNPRRDSSIVCVVENIQDVMAIEKTMQFNGLYHVLGGLISPMNGIGPNDIEIKSLCERVKNGSVKEIIFALSSTMEGDTTAFYIYRIIGKIIADSPDFQITMTAIAKGISIGDELEYTDELTLGRSILNRTKYEGN